MDDKPKQSYASVQIDKKALEASKQDPCSFVNYTYQEMLVVTDDIRRRMEAQKMFCINTDNVYMRPTPPDTRSKYRKFVDEVRHRLSNAWQMLKGADWE